MVGIMRFGVKELGNLRGSRCKRDTFKAKEL